MRKILSVITAVVAMMALAVALTGCGATANDEAKAKETFVGSWDIVEFVNNGEDMTEMINLMKQYGADVGLDIAEDGSLKLNIALGSSDESMEGSWTVKNATTIEVELQGAKSEAVYADGQIVIEQADGKMVCTRK